MTQTLTTWDDEPIGPPFDPTKAVHRSELRRLVQLERDGIVALRDFPYCRNCLANLDETNHFRGCGNTASAHDDPRMTEPWPGIARQLSYLVEPDYEQGGWNAFAPAPRFHAHLIRWTDSRAKADREADDHATNAMLALFFVMGCNRKDWTE